MTSKIFERHVPAISCDHCAATIRSALGALGGVDTVEVDVAARRVLARYDPDRLAEASLITALEEQGYPPA